MHKAYCTIIIIYFIETSVEYVAPTMTITQLCIVITVCAMSIPNIPNTIISRLKKDLAVLRLVELGDSEL